MIGFELVRTPGALNTYAYPCDTVIPSNGSFANFSNVGNCSCAACDLSCPAPPVDASIGFFDGFDGILVAIVYGALVAFSIVYTLIKQKFLNKADSELEEDLNPENNQNVDDSNVQGGVKNLRIKGGPKINNSEISFGTHNNSQLMPHGGLGRISGDTNNMHTNP